MTLTPLIDVIFLLLLFFMLSSTFSHFSEIPVKAPGQRSGAAIMKVGALLTVNAEGYVLNGDAQPQKSLAASLALLKEKGAERVVILIESSARSQGLVDALEAARKAAMPVSISRRKAP